MMAVVAAGRSVSLACISSRKASLWANFAIERGIGNVAAGRHVEIMQRDRVLQPSALAELTADMAAIDLAAESADSASLERQPREHHDAVIALLAVERDMLVAKPLEALARKAVVGAFGLLQAQDIGTHRFDEFGDEIDAKPHRIDVPGGDRNLHAWTV